MEKGQTYKNEDGVAKRFNPETDDADAILKFAKERQDAMHKSRMDDMHKEEMGQQQAMVDMLTATRKATQALKDGSAELEESMGEVSDEAIIAMSERDILVSTMRMVYAHAKFAKSTVDMAIPQAEKALEALEQQLQQDDLDIPA